MNVFSSNTIEYRNKKNNWSRATLKQLPLYRLLSYSHRLIGKCFVSTGSNAIVDCTWVIYRQQTIKEIIGNSKIIGGNGSS